MLSILNEVYQSLLASTPETSYRYLYTQFNLRNRLTGLIGPRGVGKTTLMLQYIKKQLAGTDARVLYFSADHIYFNQITLLEFVHETHQQDKIDIYFIDEVHKYKNWDQELKNIYDSYPDVKVVFSGSSSIDLIKGTYDLSRRAKLYHLEGLSFREYLNYKNNMQFDAIALETMLTQTKQLDQTWALTKGIKRDFWEYLQYGYYPFIFEGKDDYYEKINQIVDKTIYEDIANFYKLKTENLHYFKKILNYLTAIPPGTVNTHNLANNLGINDRTALHYLTILNETGLVRLIYPQGKGRQLLRKAGKVFLHNTTLHYAIGSQLNHNLDKGTLRELVFIQSLEDAGDEVFYHTQGDYQVNDKIFEVGGKNKSNKQIRNTDKAAYLVKDDILTSQGQSLPLYYFGFCY